MDIEQFYDENEKRRNSAEVEFGSQWSNAAGRLYKLSWVQETGELYLMSAPYGEVIEDPVLGDTVGFSEPLEALTVQVVGQFAALTDVEKEFVGWEDVINEENSLKWLHHHLHFELDL